MLDAPQVFVKQKGRSIMAEVSDELLRQLLAQQVQARRSNGPTWFGFVALLFVLCGAGWWAASNLSIDGVPVGTTVVPTIRALPSRVPPVKRDAPAVVVQTVLVPTTTPQWPDRGGNDLQFVAETPLPGEFWTESEKATFVAVDATATAQAQATAEAFYDASTLPTPAPALVSEMEQKCNDADLVARSPLLELWCADIYGD